jgi:high-affinity Fe2+/Pb2+ permease
MAMSPLFWMTNALNVLDALLTAVLIDMGLAGEANPLVASIGWHGKFALVLAASLVLDRLRPGALVIPCVALSAVVCYSAVGLFVLI